MAVSKRLRYEILRRDNHACRYCGATAPDAALTIDHVVPTTLGGTDDPTNLVAACRDCNAGKSSASADSSLIADVAADAFRWARAMQLAADQANADRETRYAASAAVCAHWDTVMSQWVRVPADWERSVNWFTNAGLTIDDLTEAVDIAAAKYGVPNPDRWRYFCGVCNSMLRQRREAAAALLAAEEPPKTPPYAAERKYAQDAYFTLSNFCDGEILKEAGLL